MKFRLRAGQHVEPIIPFSELEAMDEGGLLAFAAAQNPPLKIPRLKADLGDEERRLIIETAIKGREVVYHWQLNPIIETDRDLVAQFGPEKFERLHEAQQVQLNPTVRVPGEADEAYQERLKRLLQDVNAAMGGSVSGGLGVPSVQQSSKGSGQGHVPAGGKVKYTSSQIETVNSMDEKSLRKFAEEEEYSLPGNLKGRDQVLAAVKSQMGI